MSGCLTVEFGGLVSGSMGCVAFTARRPWEIPGGSNFFMLVCKIFVVERVKMSLALYLRSHLDLLRICHYSSLSPAVNPFTHPLHPWDPNLGLEGENKNFPTFAHAPLYLSARRISRVKLGLGGRK